MKSKIEQFAETHFKVKLSLYQMTLLRAWSTGSPAVILGGRAMGTSIAKRIYYAYLQDAVKDNYKETAAKVAKEF